MKVPAWLLRHRITVEPYLGVSAYGPRYGPPETGIRALVGAEIKLVRNATGAQIVSTAQIIADPEFSPPTGSRITLPDGRRTIVINVAAHTAPGLPVPENAEVMCE
ncbi:hypothetical protein [Streptomyces phaeochromogenes]